MANLKRHTIELVMAVKEGELETKTFLTPPFIKFNFAYEAVDLMDDLMENKKKKSQKELIEAAADFVVRAFGDQFTKDELMNGLHAPQLAELLYAQVRFVAYGDENEETKKFLATKR